MHRNRCSISPYLCGCNCDYSYMYSTSLRTKSSTPRHESPHILSCCCNYNPFTDETKDTEIHDLEFTLRKLAVMKCQMKKWRVERLQLESETRSLKNTLQSLGVNVGKPLKDDPLLVHYRDENIRLEKIKEKLEEKIRELEEAIGEDELFKNSCGSVQRIREQMRHLHEQSNNDKKQLKEIIMELKTELAETGGESSCAGATRLRAKIRELIDEREKKMIADKHEESVTLVKKSIDTLTAMSKSCDDLRVENKHIRTELIECNNLIAELQRNVNEKDNFIRNLQERNTDNIKSMRMNHEKLLMEIAGDKDELKKFERKMGESFYPSEQSSLDQVELNHLKSQLETIQPQFDELKIERDKLSDEVNKFHDILLDKNDQINKMLDEKDDILNNSVEKNAVLQDRIDALLNQDILSRNEIDKLKEQTQIIEGLVKENSELMLKLTNMEKEMSMNEHKIDSESVIKLARDSHVSRQESQVLTKESEMDSNERKSLQKQMDGMEMKINNSKGQLAKYKDINGELNRTVAILEREKSDCEIEMEHMVFKISQLESSKKILQDEMENLNDTIETLMNRLEIPDESKDTASLESTISKEELDQLHINLDNARRVNDDLKTERDTLKLQMVEIQKELSTAIANNVDLTKAIDKPTSELNELQLENETLKKKLVELQSNIDNCQSEIFKGRLEIDKLTGELEDTKKELKSNHTRMSELDNELSNFDKINSDSEILQKLLTVEKIDKDIALNKIKNLDEELHALKRELINCRNNNEIMRNDLNDTKKQYTQLNIDTESFKSEVKTLLSINEKLQSDNEQIKRNSMDAQTLKIEVDILKIDNIALKDEGDRLRIENSNIRIDLDDLKGWKDKYVKIKDEFDKLTSELETLSKSHDNSKQEVRDLNSKFNDLTVEKGILLTKLNDMREEVNEFKKNIFTKNTELKEAEVVKHQLIALKNELKKFRQNLEQCNRELDSSQKQIDILKSENEMAEGQLRIADMKIDVEKNRQDIDNERDALRKQLEKSRINIDEIKENVSSKNSLLKELNALKNTFGKLRKDFEKCNTENEGRERELDKWQNNAMKSKMELDKVKIENVKFANEVKATNNKLSHLNRELADVKLQSSNFEQDLTTMREEMKNTMAECNVLRADNAKLQTDKDDLQHEYDRMKHEQKDFVDNVNERDIEIKFLTAENYRIKTECETALNELKSLSRYNEKITIKQNKNEDKLSLKQEENENLKQLMEEIEFLRIDNNELSQTLQKLINDIDKSGTENQISEEHIGDSLKLKNAPDDVENWLQIAHDYKRENDVLNNNLELKMDDSRTIKRDTVKVIKNTNSLQSGTLTEYIQLEDVEQWRWEVEQLKTEIERLKKENEIFTSDGKRQSTIQQLLDELEGCKKSAVDLRMENIRIESDYDEIGRNNDRPKRNVQLKKPPQISREQPNAQILSDTQDISNELIRALDVVRMKMEKQRKGVKRMRRNIGNMAREIWSEASKYIDLDDLIVLDTMNPIIAEVLELSNDLSRNISNAEKEFINLAKMWRIRWEENVKFRKLVENLSDVETFEALKLPEENAVKDGSSFHPEGWLSSLTLTQLADLHDKISLLTSNLVLQDNTPIVCENPDDAVSSTCTQNHFQQSYDVLNQKIAALQRQIGEKQTEAGWKILEMRQILREEQVELIRISEGMNQ